MARGFKTGGRKKGTPNKLTITVKDAITQAFNEVGGAEYLVGVAKENPAVFCQLIGKVIPLQVGGVDGGPILIATGVPRANRDGV